MQAPAIGLIVFWASANTRRFLKQKHFDTARNRFGYRRLASLTAFRLRMYIRQSGF